MMRRALSLCTALCLLAGLLAVPAAPSLVCRMTGAPMAPVAAAAAPRSCCAVVSVASSDGTNRLALTSPGCCDLRQAPEQPHTPAVATTVAPFLVAWLPVPPVLFVPPLNEPAPRAPIARVYAPRGPPPRSAPSRAPPFLS